MIRIVDVVASILGLIVLCPLLLVIFLVGLLDTGTPLFVQTRVGRYRQPFRLIKFRTMSRNTESVASHLVDKSAVTSWGGWLRKSKLDELPQLINVLKGELSLVGPRPCLFSQEEVIQERVLRDVYKVRPGITGLSQIQNIDMSTPILLAETDKEMIENMSMWSYFRFIALTIVGSGSGDAVRH